MFTTDEAAKSRRLDLSGGQPVTTQVQRHPWWPVLDIAVRLIVLWLVLEGFLALAPRIGAAVMAPGAWLSTDVAVFRALNEFESGPLRGVLFALLNEPSLAYFAIIVLLLAYCVWRKRTALPAAALAVGVALALNATATHEVHEAGAAARQRPFLVVPEARTPIQSCGGMGLVAVRDQSGPTAVSCEESAESRATLRGRDWRDIWPQFSTFPSGHVREITALAIVLAWFWRASWPFAIFLVVTMAFSRLHLGAHYPTDVLAGLLVGLWSGGITVFGLDLLRRVSAALHRIPPIGRAWDWVFVPRVAARPDRDPLAARLLRIGAFVIAAHLALLVLAFAVVSPRASHIHSVLGSADAYAGAFLVGRFHPLLAQWLSPSPVFYGVLLVGVVMAALARRRWIAGLLALGVAVVLAAIFFWVGDALVTRPPAFEVSGAAPPPGWLAAGSFPNLHVLLVATLAGVAGALWLPAGIVMHIIALGTAVTAVHAGAAWLTDALAGLVMGNVAAALGRFAVRQFVPETHQASEVPVTRAVLERTPRSSADEPPRTPTDQRAA